MERSCRAPRPATARRPVAPDRIVIGDGPAQEDDGQPQHQRGSRGHARTPDGNGALPAARCAAPRARCGQTTTALATQTTSSAILSRNDSVMNSRTGSAMTSSVPRHRHHHQAAPEEGREALPDPAAAAHPCAPRPAPAARSSGWTRTPRPPSGCARTAAWARPSWRTSGPCSSASTGADVANSQQAHRLGTQFVGRGQLALAVGNATFNGIAVLAGLGRQGLAGTSPTSASPGT